MPVNKQIASIITEYIKNKEEFSDIDIIEFLFLLRTLAFDNR